MFETAKAGSEEDSTHQQEESGEKLQLMIYLICMICVPSIFHFNRLYDMNMITGPNPPKKDWLTKHSDAWKSDWLKTNFSF